MKDAEKEKIALFRYSIIAPLITGTYEGTNHSFYYAASEKMYENTKGETVKLHPYTIYRWYRIYQEKGFDGLKPKGRSDERKSRKLDEETCKQIIYYLKEYPRIPATVIYQKLNDSGTIDHKQISYSTLRRYVSAYRENRKNEGINEMRRYELEHINEVWCGDSSVGPYIKVDGKKMKTYIIALIDDASRMIVGIDIFFNDNFVNLMSVLRSAVIRYGKPKVLNFDNGSNYRSNQMVLLAARMGSVINYNPIHTPTSKAKIERWFRTLKDHWMACLNYSDFHSLEELRISLSRYVQEYNSKSHFALNGKSPCDRFFQESEMIYRFSKERIDQIFLLELERRVSADCVIVIDNKEYEVDAAYAGRKLLLRYTPDLSAIYTVDENEKLKPIKLLNRHANAHFKRSRVMFSKITEQEDEEE